MSLEADFAYSNLGIWYSAGPLCFWEFQNQLQGQHLYLDCAGSEGMSTEARELVWGNAAPLMDGRPRAGRNALHLACCF